MDWRTAFPTAASHLEMTLTAKCLMKADRKDQVAALQMLSKGTWPRKAAEEN